MKLDVHVLVLTDPTTQRVQPIACMTELAVVEKAKAEAADNLEMTAALMSPDLRDDMHSVVRSLRIVPGKLEIDA